MPTDVQALTSKVKDLSEQVDYLLAVSDMTELRRGYQTWYSQAYQIVSTHLPNRLTTFENLHYTPSKVYSPEAETETYCGIRSYLRGDGSYKPFRQRFKADFEQQQGILLAVPDVIELRALEVRALVTADLVNGELNQARLLLDHGFLRAAGALAGVALEAHLKLLHEQSGLQYIDRDTLRPLALRLRQNGVITLGDEKKCDAMADTRNKCDHKNRTDPTEQEVSELIEDVDRFTKRVQVV
jgi:hypothetical protein